MAYDKESQYTDHQSGYRVYESSLAGLVEQELPTRLQGAWKAAVEEGDAAKFIDSGKSQGWFDPRGVADAFKDWMERSLAAE